MERQQEHTSSRVSRLLRHPSASNVQCHLPPASAAPCTAAAGSPAGTAAQTTQTVAPVSEPASATMTQQQQQQHNLVRYELRTTTLSGLCVCLQQAHSPQKSSCQHTHNRMQIEINAACCGMHTHTHRVPPPHTCWVVMAGCMSSASRHAYNPTGSCVFPLCAHMLMTLRHTHLHQAVQQGRLSALQNGMPRVYLHS